MCTENAPHFVLIVSLCKQRFGDFQYSVTHQQLDLLILYAVRVRNDMQTKQVVRKRLLTERYPSRIGKEKGHTESQSKFNRSAFYAHHK